jgi:Flp pilus assembly protein TadD
MSASRFAMLCSLALGCTLAGCAAPSGDGHGASAPVDVSTLSPEQMLAAVEAAGGRDDREVLVQPLRDPQVEDLREQAQQSLRTGDHAAAAESLNQALMIGEPEPGVLQERAEVALLQGDVERAETLARRALDLGSRVGPLCRRHWATIEQARLARGFKDDAASARVQIDACTVAGFDRM